jgi:3',5'-cyclic AMP phosphodiesterase CpdA
MRVTALFLCAICAAPFPGCDVQRGTTDGPEIVVGSNERSPLLKPASLKFAVIGDSGRWSTEQRETAAQLARQRENFRFDFVLMLGDNNYGDGSPESYLHAFEEPFEPLLKAGVRFYAARGNHDVGPQWNYPLFNMGGHRYYTFEDNAGVAPPLLGERVRFFAVDSVNLDDDQMSWLDRQLSKSKAGWKIVFLHHPIYSSGRYAYSSAIRRRTLEQTLIEHQVDVVFSGHEHLYERMMPQGGVVHFVNGAAGSVRTGDLQPSTYQAKGYDRDLSFMLIEVAGNTLYFDAITRTGEVIDSGRIIKRNAPS